MKTSEFMPYIVFIAAPPVEIQRNMHEYARLKGKTDKMRGVSQTVVYILVRDNISEHRIPYTRDLKFH